MADPLYNAVADAIQQNNLLGINWDVAGGLNNLKNKLIVDGLWPADRPDFQNYVNSVKKSMESGSPPPPSNTKDPYDQANNSPNRDPLVLDLDGDGIETVSSDNGITFDFNGDGKK